MKDRGWPILTFTLSLCVLSSIYAFKGNSWQLGIPEPQTQRVVEVGKSLWVSSTLSAPLKQGQLQQVAQEALQLDFEYLQG